MQCHIALDQWDGETLEVGETSLDVQRAVVELSKIVLNKKEEILFIRFHNKIFPRVI